MFMRREPAQKVRHVLGNADEVRLVDLQERVGKQNRPQAVMKVMLGHDPAYLHSNGHLFLGMNVVRVLATSAKAIVHS